MINAIIRVADIFMDKDRLLLRLLFDVFEYENVLCRITDCVLDSNNYHDLTLLFTALGVNKLSDVIGMPCNILIDSSRYSLHIYNLSGDKHVSFKYENKLN